MKIYRKSFQSKMVFECTFSFEISLFSDISSFSNIDIISFSARTFRFELFTWKLQHVYILICSHELKCCMHEMFKHLHIFNQKARFAISLYFTVRSKNLMCACQWIVYNYVIWQNLKWANLRDAFRTDVTKWKFVFTNNVTSYSIFVVLQRYLYFKFYAHYYFEWMMIVRWCVLKFEFSVNENLHLIHHHSP